MINDATLKHETLVGILRMYMVDLARKIAQRDIQKIHVLILEIEPVIKKITAMVWRPRRLSREYRSPIDFLKKNLFDYSLRGLERI